MKFPRIFRSGESLRSKKPVLDWRKQITKQASALIVGGRRPSGELTASCFGEVRVSRANESWPERDGKPLWPVCQLNLKNAPFVPENLSDVALLQIFVCEDWWSSDYDILDSSNQGMGSIVIRVYECLDGLTAVKQPIHDSVFLAFEAYWKDEKVLDYPSHDTMPIDFDALEIGDYYEQEGIEGLQSTKIGGWPSCIQSEPWWDYKEEGKGFEYALQIDSEGKANCNWEDGGVMLIARHKTQKSLWAIDVQSM